MLVSRQSELSRLDIELIMISRVGVGVGAETGNQGGEVGLGRNQILFTMFYLFKSYKSDSQLCPCFSNFINN